LEKDDEGEVEVEVVYAVDETVVVFPLPYIPEFLALREADLLVRMVAAHSSRMAANPIDVLLIG
jgi:deoxyinosine 3'endonuclease (endonuclease V)